MTASSKGHVDIVRILIEAKAHVDTQEEVHAPYIPIKHTVQLSIIHCVSEALLGELCVSVHRMAGLLFIWQLKKAKRMW